MNNFINTAATDISRARTVGQNQLTPEPFPVLVVGTKSTQSFFFSNRGTIESWSGNGQYDLRLTIGSNVRSGPVGNTFTLTVGDEDPVTIPYDVDRAGLQNILNDIETIQQEGGVEVLSFGFGKFLIAYLELGVVSDIEGNPALLIPDCTAEVITLRIGGSSVRQLLSLELQQVVPLSTRGFSTVETPYAGWSGYVDLTSPSAFQFIMLHGVPRGEYIEAPTILMLEVLDSVGAPTCYYQTQITLRLPNAMLTQTMQIGPTENAQASTGTGSITVIPESQIHTERITFTGIAGTRNVIITQPAGLVAGARLDIVALFPTGSASNGTDVFIYLGNTLGDPIASFSRDGDETSANWFFSMNEGVTAFQLKQQLIPAFPEQE